jgi:predicted nucleic acid-binding protein
MGGVGRIYLDTNIFISAFEMKSEVSQSLLDLLSQAKVLSNPRFVTSEMTLAELLVLPLRTNDVAQITLYSVTIAPSAWLDVQPVSREILVRAAGLRASVPSRRLPDAVHLATAMSVGCTHLLTLDKGIRPQAGEILPLTVLNPDEPTLTSLIESLAR